MEIDQIREERAKLAAQITALAQSFEEKTGTILADLRLQQVDMTTHADKSRVMKTVGTIITIEI